MNSRQRVMAALNLEEPDRVPFMDFVDNVVKQNITSSAQNLRAGSTILEGFVKSNKLQIAKAYYELDSGKVHWL